MRPLFEFGHHALHLPADLGGAEVADAAFVGVVHLARRMVLTALYGHAHLLVGFAERDACEYEAVDVLDREKVVVFPLVEDVGVDLQVREHEVAHREGAFDFGCRREQDVLEQLHVAVVADGKVRREQGDLVRYGLQAVTASAHDLEDVGVLLVGHDARPRGEVVG